MISRATAVLIYAALIPQISFAQIIIGASQDAFVNGDPSRADFPYGLRRNIRSSTEGPREAYIQFDLSPVMPPISSATLSLTVLDLKEMGTIRVRLARDTWNENTVTFNNAPGGRFTAATFRADRGSGIINIDVTDFVKEWLNEDIDNNGFVLTAESGNVRFVSKEGGMGPSLTIVEGEGDRPPSWPDVPCPCGAFYDQALDFYISAGGKLLPTDDDTNVVQCDSSQIEIATNFPDRGRIRILMNQGDSVVFDSRRQCSTFLDSQDRIDPIYHRRRDPVDEAGSTACMNRLADMCDAIGWVYQ